MKQLLIALAVFFASSAFTQTPQFRHYTVNDGLANSMVYYVLQDSKGFIWFCTESGVNRFDGRNFELFTIKDGLADNENFRCMEDSKGRIWFASYNGKLSYFNGSKFINEKADKSLKYKTETNKHIRDLIEDDDGNIWFSKFLDYLNYKYDGKKISEVKGQVDESIPNKVLFNYNHTINCFKFNRKELYREDLTNHTAQLLKSYKQKQYIPNECMQATAEDFLYFCSSEGLHHYTHDSIFTDFTREELGMKDSELMLAFKLIHNDLWLATCNKGLIFIPDFKTKGFTGKFSQFLNSITLSSILCDDEGGIWITTLSEGVYYIPASNNFISNVPGESFTSLEHSIKGDLFATGTYYGNFTIYSNNKPILQFNNFNPLIRIKGLKWLSDTEVLIGTDYTPFIFDLVKKEKKVLLEDYNGQIGFSDMEEGPPGLWLEGRAGIFLLTREKKLEELYRQDLSSTEKLLSITEGGTAGCWFSSITDLYWLELKTKKETRICGQEIFNSNLKDIKYINGYLWVATDGNGLFIFKDRKLLKHIYSQNSKITSDVCQKLEFDGKQDLWVATNKGVTVFNAYTMDYVMSFTSDDVLINNDIRDIDLHNKKAYVATPAGISIIDVAKFISVTKPPKLYIRSLEAAGRIYDNQFLPMFNYYNGVIKLSYSAITFQSNSSLVYRYKIKKESNDWNETKSQQLEFYNLSPGSYTVLICAKKYNSSWSAPISFSFTVLPLWYQSVWFLATSVVLVLLLILFIAFRIIQTSKQKNEITRRMLESELKVIRLHMNPHFIFNTLNSLQFFIFKNKFIEVNTYIAKFSQLIRWIMSYSDKQEITLKEELDFLKTYIELEQLRFEKAFTLTLEVDEDLNLEGTRIPPLIVQPFVENAIKYGLSGKEEKGSLFLSFRKKDNYIFVIVEDNGVGRDHVKKEQQQSQREIESTGIKYTEERLKLLIKDLKVNMPLKIIDLFDAAGKATGTRIELIVPILL